MKTLKILNIVNFIRGCEPRLEMDLYTPVKKQLELLKKTGLKSTFLFQYDALKRRDILELFGDVDKDKTEIGGWFEVVREQVEKCGLKWRGRPGFDWDHFAEVDTPMGYPVRERIALVDEYMSEFKAVFGYYPKSMGAWAIDAFTLGYMRDKYSIEAFCICREQVGTDGYNFSGGYYAGGYYASRNNMLCPAQTKKEQIDVPVFRMLGSDIVKQYYSGLDENFNPAALQGVVTLEPVGNGEIGGSNPRWVDWFLDVTYDKALNFAYTQAGQENSFGWKRMRDGLEYQFGKIAEDEKHGKYEVLTLGECGREFKNRFAETPATTTTALGSFDDKNEGAIWYECKNYRVGYYHRDCEFLIRDIYLFNEKYKERYLDSILKEHDYAYDNLPLLDGYLFGGNGIRAGIYLLKGGEKIKVNSVGYVEIDEDTVEVDVETDGGKYSFVSSPDGISVSGDGDFSLAVIALKCPYFKEISDNLLKFEYNGFKYSVAVNHGALKPRDNAFEVQSCDGMIKLKFIGDNRR